MLLKTAESSCRNLRLIRGKNTHKIFRRNYAKSVFPILPVDTAGYDIEGQILPILHDALSNKFDRIRSAHENLSNCVVELQDKANGLFRMDMEITILYYLGLCNGAGWATKLDGKNAILLGAEKIAELGWHEPDTMCNLLGHELAHLIHFEMRKDLSRCHNLAIWQLYTEGFATRYSQLLYKKGLYSQNKNGWLNFCRCHLDEIKADYFRHLQSGEQTANFFGDWNSWNGVSDVGYYLGREWICELQKRYSNEELARLPTDLLENEIYMFLKPAR